MPALEAESKPAETQGSDTSCSWNSEKASHRCFFLIFLCFLVFGGYFCYDTPGALQDQITSDMQVSVARFASLYAIYSWPNIVLCFFGGFIVDRLLGIRWGAAISSVAVLIGQLLVTLGAFIKIFWLMELGRFLFGVGLEIVLICQNVYAPRWFKPRELNAVFGLQISIARVGSTLNFILSPIIYDWVRESYTGHKGLGITMFVVTLTCVLSQVCSHMLCFLDMKAFPEKQNDCDKGEKPPKIKLKDIKDFSFSFWLLCIICICFYSVIIPFVGLGKVLFQKKYGMTDISGWNSASTVDSAVYFISTFASPICGIGMSKFGYNSLWVLLSVLLSLLCLTALCFTFINPWIPMVLLGLGYSVLAASLWPMVAQEVPSHQLATAFGIMQSFMNLGLAVFPLIAGLLVDLRGYIFLQIFFIECMCVAAIAALLLFMKKNCSQTNSYNMNRSSNTFANKSKSSSEAAFENNTNIPMKETDSSQIHN